GWQPADDWLLGRAANPGAEARPAVARYDHAVVGEEKRAMIPGLCLLAISSTIRWASSSLQSWVSGWRSIPRSAATSSWQNEKISTSSVSTVSSSSGVKMCLLMSPILNQCLKISNGGSHGL